MNINFVFGIFFDSIVEHFCSFAHNGRSKVFFQVSQIFVSKARVYTRNENNEHEKESATS